MFSLLANATVINITPTSPKSSDNLRQALASAADGDIIEMADGTYVESPSNYIAFDGKHVTVRAAEGADVLIQPQVPITIANGGCAHFENVKIDASHLMDVNNWYSHSIYPADASENNRIILDGCEMYGFNLVNSAIYCGSSYKLDAVSFNNCYFHDMMKSVLFIESTAGTAVQIANSTFANIETSSSYSAGVIDTRATSGSFSVDHCTFYNCQVINTDYGTIGKVATPGAVVSNCIFAMPTSTDNLRAIRDVATANNCLTYNYTKDSGKGIHGDVQKNNCIFVDPLFTDAANGDFSFANNWVTMSISPACGAATDGSDLGDPRWYSDPVVPSSNFASPGYTFLGTKAQLSGSFALNGDNYIQSQNTTTAGVAIWKIEATRKCIVEVTLNIASANTSGHLYEVALYDADNALVGSALAEEKSWSAGDKVLGTLEIPAAGIYIVKLTNSCDYSSTIIEGVKFLYVGGAVQNLPGTTNIADAWFSSGGTRADGKIDFPDGYIQDGWVKWNVAFASAVKCNVTVNIDNANGHNYTVALYRSESDESPITLSEGKQKSTIGTLELGAMEVPAGNYILKVTNAVQYSDAKLISVTFAYAGGAAQNIPCAITLSDAIFSSRAYIDGSGYLHFTDADHLGTISGEWAKWNIHAASEGVYTFTAHCRSTNWSNLTFKVLDTDENELYSYTPEWTYQSDDKTITSPEWILAAGDYVLKLSNPANNSDGYLLSLAAAKSDIIVLDENATSASVIHDNNGVSDKKIALKRSFKADMYNTICLPFSDWNSSLELVFGTGYQLLKLNTATIDGDVLDLEFETVTELGHGRPYLIKPTKDVTNPIFGTGHTIDERTSGYSTTVCDNADFIGNFIKGTIPAGEDNLFLGQNNLLYFSESTTTIKGMRAYFEVKNSSGTPIRHARIVEQSEVVTELELINGEWQDIKAANGTIKTIENGQLILIRDGKRYNVMGIRF